MSSDVPTYETLVHRIEKIEQENRRMRRAALALLILPLALVLMAQSQTTKVVEANEFVLKDVSGHMRARLWFGLKPGKSPTTAMLDFFDSAGQDLLSLSANGAERSANLNLGGLITTVPTLTLSASAKGSYASLETGRTFQGINLSADTTNSRIALSGTGDPLKGGVNLTDGAEGGSLYVNDTQGGAGVFIIAGGKNKNGLAVMNREGRQALLLGDSISLGHAQDNTSAVLYNGKDGPYLNLGDAQGFNVQLGVSKTIAKTTGQQHTSSAASLQMFNAKGDVLWSAP